MAGGEKASKQARKSEAKKERTLRTKRQPPSGRQEGKKHHGLELDTGEVGDRGTGPCRLQGDLRSVSTGCRPSLVMHLVLESVQVTESCASVSPSGT